VEYKYLDNWPQIPSLAGLKDLSNPPDGLYISGRFQPHIFKNCTAVVGSRRMTDYGRRAVEQLVPQLVSEGKTIVSGFMYGVDLCAHQACLKAGGQTIAVLGWGIRFPLKGQEVQLARDITRSGGLLVSEWFNQPPARWTFPVRNRLVAAFATDLYVIEAALKSGSLITARIAHRLNRRLWAVPGPATSPTSAGTNALLAAGQAKPWLIPSPPTP
jgi:DNA processing protein